MSNKQKFVEVALTIEDAELHKKIEKMADDLQVTPVRLIEAIIHAKFGNKGVDCQQ